MRCASDYDVSVYLDTPEPLRHRWKVSRDTAKRGYSETQVQELLERRETVSEKFIRPQREHADMVVRFRPGPNAIDDYETCTRPWRCAIRCGIPICAP